MHQIVAYFKFLWRSTNQHGVHSPFVYNLVTRCFYDRKEYEAYKIIQNYRNRLLKNHKSIRVKDFGAGSRIFSSEERKISAIAKNSGITSKRARLLYRIVTYLKVKNVLELGTSLGIGSMAIAAKKQVQLTTLEGCPATAKVAGDYFAEFGMKNIQLIVGEFEEILPELKKKRTGIPADPAIDLIYFDGNHQKEATLAYFEELLPLIHNDSVFIFDDIHWSADMEEAWTDIKNHPRVKVSIDTFYWGLVFFRREQEKEHFVIRV